MECTYKLKIKGKAAKNFTNYVQLLNWVIANNALDYKTVSDVLCSRGVGALLPLTEILDRIRKTWSPVVSDSMINSEPDALGALSILDFLDTDAAAIDGERLVPLLSREDYIENLIGAITLMEDITEEEARKIVDQRVKNWDIIKEDAFAVHQMLTHHSIYTPGEDVNTLLADVPTTPRLSEVVRTRLFTLAKEFYKYRKGNLAGSVAYSNFNMISKLRDSDKEILGHIDHLFVGHDGHLHAYIFKASTTPPEQWSLVKEEKYKYQLAFIKLMLANHGLDTRNMDLNIVPVQIKYNDDHTEVTDILIHTERTYGVSPSTRFNLQQELLRVSAFITDNSIKSMPTVAPLDRADEINRTIFPELNIVREGIDQSARLWIARAPEVDLEGEDLVIINVGEPDHGYDVKINGKTYVVKSNKPKESNKELITLILDHLSELRKDLPSLTQHIRDVVHSSWSHALSLFGSDPRFSHSIASLNLEALFDKYIPRKDFDGNHIVEWDMIEDLLDLNIIMFRNRDSGLLDVVSLTPFDLNATIKFKKADTVLGSYLTRSQYIDLASNYGNIEMVRAMTLINEVLPTIPGMENIKLGDLHVMSASGDQSFITANIGEFNRRFYAPIIRLINKLVATIQVDNNFQHMLFVDECASIYDRYKKLMEGHSIVVRNQFEKFGFNALAAENQDGRLETKIHALLQIQENILRYNQWASDPESVKAFINDLNPGNRQLHELAILYDLVTKAYLSLTGGTPVRYNEWDPVSAYALTSFSLPDDNVRLVADNMLKTHDAIAEEFMDEADNHLRPLLMEFYKAKGYDSLRNMTLGDQARMFRNLLDPTSDVMAFKDPYDMTNDLAPEERKLLKHMLYLIYRIDRDDVVSFVETDEKSIKAHIAKHKEYLWMPMERASDATARTTILSILAKWRNSYRALWDGGRRFNEFVLGMTQEEMSIMGKDDRFVSLSLHNTFETNMPGTTLNVREVYAKRRQLIEKYGKDFFEYNLENIMYDYLFKHILVEQMAKMLVATKALMLLLHFTGDFNGNQETVLKEIKYILDYLKLNVFHRSIMSKTERAIVGRLAPLRRFATRVLLGGNLISMFRDSIEGLLHAFIRTVIKLNTDIDPKSLAKAYAYVTKHSTTNAMAVNLLSKLCLRYRLSNTDVGRIAERAKTGRNGIVNYDTWLFGTLRTPDFMNRMALFVARCMHDGVWDAFSISEDNKLVYDWKKDARFNLVATNNKTDEEAYKKQLAFYWSKIREYNIEHPDNQIETKDDGTLPDLPTPYSDVLIRNIQSIADNIYGAYDKSKKSMAEHMSLGWTFGMFFTWMNGIMNNYFAPAHKGVMGRRTYELEYDYAGRPIYFNADGSLTLEDTGMPVSHDVPMIVQGILPMMVDAARLYANDGWDGFKSYFEGDVQATANLRKLISDLIMMLLTYFLYKGAVTPAYEEYKKELMRYNTVIENLLTEIIYKGSSRSFDQFYGPINIIQYFSSNMNPPLATVPGLLINNTYRAIFGNMKWSTVLMNYCGFTRSGKDTMSALIKYH